VQLLGQFLALGVLQFVGEDQDEVDDVPDAEAAEGDELQDAQAGVPQVEPVDAEFAQEEGEQECGQPLFLLHDEFPF